MRFFGCIFLLLGWIAVPCVVSAQSRIALVIGNSSYQNVSALPNPVNDANDISESLKRLGFSVNTLANASFDDMRHALIDFGPKARGADFAVIFFAGHGMEIGGENWLIPVDARLRRSKRDNRHASSDAGSVEHDPAWSGYSRRLSQQSLFAEDAANEHDQSRRSWVFPRRT
jgi:hypothetical protein